MSNVEEILRESIQGKCGLGGLMRFNALFTGSFETADGRPDLSGISTAVNSAFPADQAAVILATVTKRLEAGELSAKKHAQASTESPGEADQLSPSAFARYFEAEPGHVRDIVDEARRLRAAMGKPVPSHWAPHSDKVALNNIQETDAPEEAVLTEKVTEIKIAVDERAKMTKTDGRLPLKALELQATIVAARPRPRQVIAEPLSAVDEEVRKFVYSRTACTSIDIMDFIRYLKDKGYSLQEYIVLEKIYVTIEERKKEARFAIEKEIEGWIDATKAPGEPDIRGLLWRLSKAGLVFEEEDVRRMIRGAVLRRA